MTPPVADSEVLFRQISPGGAPFYYDPQRKPPVYRAAFLPTREDSDGLSFVRREFRAETWSAYRPEQPDTRFRLAVLAAGKLREFAVGAGMPGLTFRPTPDSLDVWHGEPWGHCVAAEINRPAYDSSKDAKKHIKEWALKLADSLATSDVIGPFAAPTENDPYRPA